MKYTIEGFAQDKLLELQLDVSDALILRWFIDFAGTGNMKRLIHDHQIYYYVKYSGIISDLPVLGINSTKGIGKRFDRYVEKGLLLKTVQRQGNGTILFFAPTRKLLELQYNSTKGTVVPFVESPPNLKDGYIQNELDFETDTGNKTPEKEEKNGEKQQDTEKTDDSRTLIGTGVPISTTKGTPVAFRKEPQFPSERNWSSPESNSGSHHFKTDYSTTNSSTTNSLTTKSENTSDSLDAVAVLKKAFAKKISTEVFSADFWDKTATFLSDQNLTVETIPRYVNFLFEYAQKNNPRNLTHYLYKTAATDYMVAEFQAQEINHTASAEIQEQKQKKRHSCALCLEIFEGSTCPTCGLAVKDWHNENARIEAKRRYCSRPE